MGCDGRDNTKKLYSCISIVNPETKSPDKADAKQDPEKIQKWNLIRNHIGIIIIVKTFILVITEINVAKTIITITNNKDENINNYMLMHGQDIKIIRSSNICCFPYRSFYKENAS